MADVYLDYMATTPICPAAQNAMLQAMGEESAFANPSSSHAQGQRASQLVEHARQTLADAIGGLPEGVIWTSGATESNNLAIKGAASFYARQGMHIISQKTEHKATLAPLQALESEGYNVTYLDTRPCGRLDIEMLRRAITDQTRLVSIMWVNNETGVIQPIEAIAALVRERGLLLHVDAAQALGKITINCEKVGIDYLSLSGHKCYGPKGVGALYIRQKPRRQLRPLIHGSTQEQGIRPGTVATHQVVGMAEAVADTIRNKVTDSKRIALLSDELRCELNALPGIVCHTQPDHGVPHCIAVGVQDVSVHTLLVSLPDIAISTGSACNSTTLMPSPVLLNMGVAPILAENSCRISIGRQTTQAEITYFLKRFKEELSILRMLSPMTEKQLDKPCARWPHAGVLNQVHKSKEWVSPDKSTVLKIYYGGKGMHHYCVSYEVVGRPEWFSALESFSQLVCSESKEVINALTFESLVSQLHLPPERAHISAVLWKLRPIPGDCN